MVGIGPAMLICLSKFLVKQKSSRACGLRTLLNLNALVPREKTDYQASLTPQKESLKKYFHQRTARNQAAGTSTSANYVQEAL